MTSTHEEVLSLERMILSSVLLGQKVPCYKITERHNRNGGFARLYLREITPCNFQPVLSPKYTKVFTKSI